MKLVRQVLDSKGHDVFSVPAGLSVYDAITQMADRGIGSLLVLEDDRLLGIVTERDYARKVIIKGRSSETTTVAEIMSAEVLTTSSDRSVNECMQLMTEKKVRHLPVVDDGRVVGMVSIGDLVEALIDDQQEQMLQVG